MSRRMTRRQARKWLQPMRACFRYMLRTGDAYCIDGRPVWPAVVNGATRWERVDFCIAGFMGLINRLFPTLDTYPLWNLRARLDVQLPLTVQSIAAGLSVLNLVEDGLVRLTVAEVQSARVTEEIKIELDAMREEA